MFFTVHVREENHRPVVRVGQLVRENGDSMRIANNAEEWHRRWLVFAKQANEESKEMINELEKVGGFKKYVKSLKLGTDSPLHRMLGDLKKK